MFSTALSERFQLSIPLIQAPMAGVSTPLLAAQICNGGAIGSLGLGASSLKDAANAIEELKTATKRPFNLNFFCHKRRCLIKKTELNWLQRLRPLFATSGGNPPENLHEIYDSFYGNDALFKLVLDKKPAIASFHFGLPEPQKIAAMKAAGIYLIATATNLDEALAIEKAGFDAVIAQGYEAGGHRGMFDENAIDLRLSLVLLLKIIRKHIKIPVIAAGGIMDGHDIGAFIRLGASAVQMGTAFIACPESQADSCYRKILNSRAAYHTTMTRAFSGRPARALANQFTDFTAKVPDDAVPPYPFAYDAAKQLNKLSAAQGNFHYGAYWAGQGAPFARPTKAAELLDDLKKEFSQSI